MRPNRNTDFAPGERDIGMVSLLFGDSAHTVDKCDGAGEVRESEFPLQVMPRDDGPRRDFGRQTSVLSEKYV
jgi:hypothetical protein